MSAIAFKASLFSLTQLMIASAQMDDIAQALETKLQESQGLFRLAPVILVPQVPLTADALAQIIELCYQSELLPIGVQTQDEGMMEYAAISGLAVFRPDKKSQSPSPEAQKPSVKSEEAEVAPPKDQPSAERLTKTLSHTVRSGQQVYARGDLVILGNVNPGAEVAADGHIHIYGVLKGKALAGAQGDETARIFTKHLDAELVSIAGVYAQGGQGRLTSKEAWLQIYLEDNRLVTQGL